MLFQVPAEVKDVRWVFWKKLCPSCYEYVFIKTIQVLHREYDVRGRELKQQTWLRNLFVQARQKRNYITWWLKSWMMGTVFESKVCLANEFQAGSMVSTYFSQWVLKWKPYLFILPSSDLKPSFPPEYFSCNKTQSLIILSTHHIYLHLYSFAKRNSQHSLFHIF